MFLSFRFCKIYRPFVLSLYSKTLTPFWPLSEGDSPFKNREGEKYDMYIIVSEFRPFLAKLLWDDDLTGGGQILNFLKTLISFLESLNHSLC